MNQIKGEDEDEDEDEDVDVDDHDDDDDDDDDNDDDDDDDDDDENVEDAGEVDDIVDLPFGLSLFSCIPQQHRILVDDGKPGLCNNNPIASSSVGNGRASLVAVAVAVAAAAAATTTTTTTSTTIEWSTLP
ncbi:hypothetical protein HZH68_005012 [Vespula germanica]|uniref:Uncharacterized protein n=1 Tax=Vespula germanica TaxID=30212 RepID=A0A834KF86_VESGE|nr:hypothetical protein HZH68_005012 [Vespula germanica]